MLVKIYFHLSLYFRFCLLFSSFLPFSIASAQDAQGVLSSHKTRVAIIQDQRPNTFLDPFTGKASGFGVDLMESVAARAGLDLEFIPYKSWKDVEDAISEGEADLCPTMAVNSERQRIVNFTDSIETFVIVACVRSNRVELKDVGDLRGRKVGLVRSGMAWTELKERNELNLVPYDSYQMAMMELLAGRLDAFATASNVIDAIAQESGIEERIRYFKISDKEFKRAIGVRKSDIELYRRVNKALLQVLSSPEYERIYLRWHVRPKPFWTAARVAAIMGFALLGVLALALAWRHCSLVSMNAKLRRSQEELKAAKELAESGTRARDFFLATITHELRTPLNAILGFADFMEEDLRSFDGPKKERVAISIRTIKESGAMLLSLIEDVLELSRIEQRKIDMMNTEFSPRRSIEDVADSFLPGLLRKGVELKLELDGLPETIVADRRRFKQILYNLIGNAMKFTVRGCISVSASSSEGVFSLKVSDTGEGIPEDKLAAIFIPFYQASNDSARLHGGLGLGLAIVKKLVDLMGGEIAVSSKLGEGSEFVVNLPLSPSASPSPVATSARKEPKHC